MSGHLFGAALIIIAALAVFWLGWHSHGLYTDERAILPKHSHRKGAPVESGPRETALLQPPQPPPWRFAGESEQGWAAESAEYELLTQTAAWSPSSPESASGAAAMKTSIGDTAELPGVDTPSDFIESMTEQVSAMIAEWDAQGNYDRHTMHEVG